MGKRKKNKPTELARPPASSEQSIHPNATLGPDVSKELGMEARYSADATSAHNLEEKEAEKDYAESYPALLDKHLLSGKRHLPAAQIVFILWAVVTGWMFIQDNSSGAFKQNDWSAILWTIQKSLAIAGVFSVSLVAWFLFNKLLNWIKSR